MHFRQPFVRIGLDNNVVGHVQLQIMVLTAYSLQYLLPQL